MFLSVENGPLFTFFPLYVIKEKTICQTTGSVCLAAIQNERKKFMKQRRLFTVILALMMLFLTACVNTPDSRSLPASTETLQSEDTEASESPSETTLPLQTESTEPVLSDEGFPVEGESYYDLINVVLYLELYSELPPNYITKKEAQALGWQGGSVEKYKEGAAIGGDHFSNYEGQLPRVKGRNYTECDIDTNGYHSRGSRRLIFTDDGLYYYTSDHYETFSEVTVTEDYEVIW